MTSHQPKSNQVSYSTASSNASSQDILESDLGIPIQTLGPGPGTAFNIPYPDTPAHLRARTDIHSSIPKQQSVPFHNPGSVKLLEQFKQAFPSLSGHADQSDALILASLEPYLKDLLAATHTDTLREYFKVLYINNQQHCIAFETHSIGTKHRVIIDPYALITRSQALGASALIVVHNHISCNPNPSSQDQQSSRHLYRLLKQHSIKLMQSYVYTPDQLTAILEL